MVHPLLQAPAKQYLPVPQEAASAFGVCWQVPEPLQRSSVQALLSLWHVAPDAAFFQAVALEESHEWQSLPDSLSPCA